ELGPPRLELADQTRDQPLWVEGLFAPRIFERFGDRRKEHDRRDPAATGSLDLAQETRTTPAKTTRHRCDRLVVIARMDEERIDEAARCELGLAAKPANAGALAIAARSAGEIEAGHDVAA